MVKTSPWFPFLSNFRTLSLLSFKSTIKKEKSFGLECDK